MSKKTIKDVDIAGKRVFIRVDFNVPIKNGVIKDERRHMGFGENEIGRRLAEAPHRRARIIEVRKTVDHLILDLLADTAKQMGVPRSEQESLARQYMESVTRLGLEP